MYNFCKESNFTEKKTIVKTRENLHYHKQQYNNMSHTHYAAFRDNKNRSNCGWFETFWWRISAPPISRYVVSRIYHTEDPERVVDFVDAALKNPMDTEYIVLHMFPKIDKDYEHSMWLDEETHYNHEKDMEAEHRKIFREQIVKAKQYCKETNQCFIEHDYHDAPPAMRSYYMNISFKTVDDRKFDL